MRLPRRDRSRLDRRQICSLSPEFREPSREPDARLGRSAIERTSRRSRRGSRVRRRRTGRRAIARRSRRLRRRRVRSDILTRREKLRPPRSLFGGSGTREPIATRAHPRVRLETPHRGHVSSRAAPRFVRRFVASPWSAETVSPSRRRRVPDASPPTPRRFPYALRETRSSRSIVTVSKPEKKQNLRRKLPRAVHGREGLRLQGLLLPPRDPPVHVPGR